MWASQTVSDVGFAEDALRSEDLLAAYEAAGGSIQGVTVARTLIDISWGINEAHALGESLTVGLIKGTATAADVADPVSEPFADWAYNRVLYAGAGHGLLTADAPNVWHFDIRSMRKVDEVGETWWLIYKGTAQVTAATFDVRAKVRTLLLLP